MNNSRYEHYKVPFNFEDATYNTLIKKTAVAFIVGISLFIGTMSHWNYSINWLYAIVTFGVLVYSGGHFFISSWLALKNKSYNQELLIAIAIIANWLYTVLIQQLYFETIVIIVIVNFGLILEQYYYKKIVVKDINIDIKNSGAKIAAIITPSVIVIALITVIIWYLIGKQPVSLYMLVSFVSVLLIASPRALCLAIPTSIINGINKATQSGILIHNPNDLQTICNINTVILDKTGIITLGKPHVTEIIALAGTTPNEILNIAANLESGSERPYALAILAAAKERQLNVEAANELQRFSGLGINGIISGQPACIGNKSFMEAQLIKIDTLKDNAKNFAQAGTTAIYVASNKQLIGLLTLTDPIKPDAKFLVQKLHDMQIRVIMITGDQQLTAEAIAHQVGITEVIANVMPQEKASKISELQNEDAIVAMVGNVVNDQQALTQSDIGFAMISDTNTTTQTTNITLINNSLDNIVETIYIAKATVNNMQQNLFGAVIYNIIGIPIAAGILFPLTGVLLNPALAAAVMTLSLITIIINANRLLFLQGS